MQSHALSEVSPNSPVLDLSQKSTPSTPDKDIIVDEEEIDVEEDNDEEHHLHLLGTSTDANRTKKSLGFSIDEIMKR